MPQVRSTPVRRPCERCKAKHVKCDDSSSSCRRCISRGVACIRRTKNTLFLSGSSARYEQRFTGNETWVSGVDSRAQEASGEHGQEPQQGEDISSQHTRVPLTTRAQHVQSTASGASATRDLTAQEGSVSYVQSPQTPQEVTLDAVCSPTNLTDWTEAQHTSPWAQIGHLSGSESGCAHSLDLNQACLLKYFIDHIAQWFDTCDERDHFELFVPVWARQYPPLLNAICATASRHLYRMAEPAIDNGIQYQGQLLTGLTANTSVEYMLACIPALSNFHENRDKTHRNLIVATAIVLRQHEEMEDEGDTCHDQDSTHSSVGTYHRMHVNFLDIINAIIRSSHDEGSFNQHEFLDVAYWICLRQEVYSAFTQKRIPQMLLAPEQWANAATVNKMVMHAAQVAKWLFEHRSLEEWGRLNEQQNQLEQILLTQPRFAPLWSRPPDKALGEVFPIIWYGSDLVVIGVQHVMIARMVLIAEAPELSVARDRHAHRKAEAQVRAIILDLCGTATHRPSCAPALVNAIMGILLYGDYFTDEWERRALASVIAEFQSLKAWPLPEALRTFGPSA